MHLASNKIYTIDNVYTNVIEYSYIYMHISQSKYKYG